MLAVVKRRALGARSRMLSARMPLARILLARIAPARVVCVARLFALLQAAALCLRRSALWLCAAPLVALLQSCAKPADNTAALDAAGSWTFINYWAQWCKPCIKEIPELNTLHAIDGYRVLGVNFDGAQGEALRAQIDALGVGFPTLDEDPGARFGLDKPEVLPTTLVLTPGGELHAVLIGPQTSATLIAATESGS